MINNSTDLTRWCLGAAEEFGDPSIPVCQLFLKWAEALVLHRGNELSAGMMEGDLFIMLDKRIGPVQIPLDRYEFQRATAGVYAMSPSLNIPGLIHGYVVLYDVPEQGLVPPWEKLVVLAG